MANTSDVVFRHVNRNDLERRSRPESAHKGNLKRLKTSSVGGFQRWEKENELLWAMLEDETEWLAKLFPDIIITPELFFYALEDGSILCRLANLIQEAADDYGKKNKVKVPAKRFKFHASIQKKNKQLALFKSRENVQGFLTWCRQIGISDSILFESNDVVEADECREGCREVVICLMEIARRASGMFKFTPIPKLIQLEKEIEIEEQKEAEEENSLDQVDYASSDDESNTSCPSPEAHSPPTHDGGNHTSPGGNKKKSKKHQPKSELDKEVLKIIDNFNLYNIRKIKEGKYMILGKIIFVRMLNGHVLLRIGGGWDTLEHYLLTHMPKVAPENGHCSTDTAVSPSVAKTPQKSQSRKILDKVKKEQQLKVTPSPYRTAGRNGSKSDEENDEKDITSAIRKIEFSVNQNIATRRKVSRHSQDETPQKSPQKSPNSVEVSSLNTASDINQNNIGEKISKSKSPEGKNMESEGNVFNEHNGDVFSSEQQNGEMLNFEGALVKENSNAESSLSPEQSETTENTPDVVDGAVLAKLDTESATELNTIEQEESKQAELEPAIDITNPCDNEQSSDHPEFSVENSEEPSSEQAPPAEAMTEDLDVVPNESEIAKNYNDVPPKDAEVSASIHEVPPSDSDVPPGDAEIPASDAQVLPSDGEVPPKDPDVSPAVIPEDSKTSESPSPTPESTSSASTTPDIPQSPQKCPSPSGKKDGVEPLKKKTGKTTKDSTKTKPAGTKAAAKKEPGSTMGSRPKSAKPSTRPTADSSAVKNTKRPTSAVKSSTTAKSGTTTKSSTTVATKTKTTGDGKPSAAASKTKAPPSGKPTTTKTPSGKTSPTHSKKATNKPDPKATPSTRTARPARTTAFGSTVSTAAAKKPAPKTRPATAPPARSTTTQAKKKPVAAKVQTWSSSATRPQSAKPSTKSNDSTDGVAASKEIGGDRPTSPTKPLVRKTQTRTVTTTKTTRVGAGGDPETKSQTLKTTRTVTEANGKKTTKTTVKEISPTGRKPLRMTTETTEGGTGAKKPTKAVTDSKTGTRTAKPGTKKPETKSGAKTGPSRPTKETGAKKATTKTASKGKEVKGEIKGVPKAKTVKELSNALGITKPSDGKEKDDKDIETEPKESVEKKVEEPRPAETPELVVKAETVKELSVASGITILKTSDGKEDTKIGPKEEKEVEEPRPAEMPELAPAQIEESPQVDESVQVEESVEVEELVQECDLSEVSPEAEEVAPECEVTVTDQDGESGVINDEGGIEEVPQGHEDSDGSEDIVENTEAQSVQQENNEVAESAEDLENASDQGEEIDHRVLMNGDTVEQSADIVSDVNLVDLAEDINIEDKMAEPAEQVEENKDEIGNEIAANDDEESGEPIIDFVHQVLIEAHEEELRDPSELIVQDSPEPRNSSGIIDDSLEDDSLDIIVVPESDVSYEEGALQSTEAWPAVSVGQEIDLLGDNNNAVEETEPKLNPYLIPSGADPEEPADSTADQDLFDINADGKAEPWFVGDTGNTGEPTNRDSGFQENNTVDDLLG